MDPERLKWITSPPTLDRWEVGVRLSATPGGLLATYTAMGYSDRKRGALWVHGDTCPTGHDVHDLGDRLAHLANVISQVRPVTEAALLRGLDGAYWEQPDLWGEGSYDGA